MNRILIVDAEAGPRADLEQIFADRGDNVARAASCAEGIEVLTADRPVAVLCYVASVGTGRGSARGAASPVDLCRAAREALARHQLSIVLYSRTPLAHGAISELLGAGADVVVGPDQMAAIEAVVDASLRTQAVLQRAAESNAQLRDDNRRLDREVSEHVGRAIGAHASDPTLVANELVASRPDGVLVVSTDGGILSADLGAQELLGQRLVGRSIGSIVPRSRLASFVGKAGPDDHDRFSFDVAARSDRATRRLQATVNSVGGDSVVGTSGTASASGAVRVVLLLDLDRRGPVERTARSHAARVPDQYYRRLLRAARVHHALETIPQSSPASSRLVQALAASARTLQPVLLRGPEGSGRRACAEILHHARHSTGPFLEIACDGLGEASQEVELFGARLATGEASSGLVARATDGTLVLHEIDQLSLAMQSKVAAIAKDPHLRIIGTTRSSTEALVASGRMLEDLARAFAGSVIDVPPLRERRQDLPELIARTVGRETYQRFTTPALQALVAWDWPGGITEFERELARIQALGRSLVDTNDLDPEIVTHAVTHALPERLRELEIPTFGAAAQSGGSLPYVDTLKGALPSGSVKSPDEAQDAPLAQASAGTSSPASPRPTSFPSKFELGRSGAWIPEPSDWLITDDDPLDLEVYEQKALLRALAMAKGNRTLAARLAGIGKSTYYRKLHKWGLSEGSTPAAAPRPPADAQSSGDGGEASPPT